jgi:peroxiredoxin
VLALIAVVASLAIYHLLVQQGKLSLRLETVEENLRQQGIAVEPVPEVANGRPPGYVLNNFELPELSGGSMTMWQLRGRKVLLIFLDPACAHSRAMLVDLAAVAAEAKPEWPEPVIISTRSEEENRRLFAKYEIGYPILLQEGMEVAELLLVPGTPMGYSVDESGATVGKLLVGSEALLAAARLGATVANQGAAGGPRVGRDYSRIISRPIKEGMAAGTRAPAFTLPQLDGGELSLASFRGHRVLLVFSDPACDPCDELAVKLEHLHRRREDLRVLMIGRGDPEANRRKASEHKITFPVALQRHWEVSRLYGMFATPIGYLINQEGFLISNVLVGVDAILEAAAAKNAHINARTKVLASQ